jgi:3D (Asp-Asp-Asp) domain-containing protein
MPDRAASRGLIFSLCLGLGACATQNGPREFKPPKTMTVRTTAYNANEPGGARNALGSRLRFGSDVSSAATDWSWIPVGTRFRIKETGRVYVVEDYGSALVGRQTVDLYFPNDPMTRAWGVRQVQIEILEWGSVAMSKMLLQPRRGSSPHVNRMLASLEVQQRKDSGSLVSQ